MPAPARRPLALLALLLAAASAPGCAQEGPVHRGGYVSGLETSSFTPCAAEYEGEQWWLDADSASWARLERVMDRLRPDTAGSWVHAEAFVAVRGSVTDRGEYGHVGAYDRRIRVTEVLEAVPADSASCP